MDRAIHSPRAQPLRSRPRAAAACALAVFLVLSVPLADAAPAPLDASALEARIAALESSTAIDERVRSQAIGALRQGLAALETQREEADAVRSLDELVAQGRARIDAAQARAVAAEQSPAAVPAAVLDGSARTLQTELERARVELTSLESALEAVRRDLTSDAERPAALRDAIVRERQALDALVRRLDEVATAADQDPAVTEAMAASLPLRIAAERATLERLQKQLLAQPLRQELLQAERRELLAEQRSQDERVAQLERALTTALREETLRTIADAGVEVPEAAADHPAVRALRDANVASAERLTALGDLVEAALAERERIGARAAGIGASLAQAERKLEIAGADQVIGRVLIAERRNLPRTSIYRARSAQRESTVRDVSLLSLALEEELTQLRDVDAYRAALPGLDGGVPPIIERTVDDLLEGRVRLVERTLETNNQYLDALAELSFEEEGMLRVALEFESLLSRRLLWIRTREVISLTTLGAVPGELREFADASWWRSALVGLGDALLRPLGVLGLLLSGALLLSAGRWRAALARSSEGLHKPSQDRFSRTVQALGLSAVLALPVPVLIAFLAQAATESPSADGAPQAIGRAALALVPITWMLLLLRNACFSGGLFDAHFRLPSEAVRRFRRALEVFLPAFLLPAFLIALSSERRGGLAGGELDRLLVLCMLAALGVLVWRLLQPRTGIVAALRQRGTGDEPGFTDWCWLVLGAGTPLALGAIALLGFLFSAQELMGGMVQTLGLVAALLFIQEFVQRALLVARRRIQLQQALRRREVRSATDEAPVETAADAAVDLPSLDKDTRTLVRTLLVLAGAGGVFLIWSALLPALTVLDDITLWTTSAGVADGDPLRPVSAGDTLLALLVGFLTLVGARTLPSLLEIVLRQRAELAPGSRVAFSTLARYAIVVLGAFVALNLLGASWSRLQWLVAALGVGIGFGLQEIVANFISGLIILIERPVRVGDVVTVGEVEGTVTRIRIRATTVTDWNRMEYLIPNREFITGHVLNWTLSDEVTRLQIPVGVAYGSDVDRAREIMLACAAEHPAVVDDPPPGFYFLAFGDNALNLELRCHVAKLADRLPTTTDLHGEIYRRFADAGIEISFPQRDVHLDTNSPLEIRLSRDGDGAASA